MKYIFIGLFLIGCSSTHELVAPQGFADCVNAGNPDCTWGMK